MTKPLPNRDVSASATRSGRPRLTAVEQRVLADVDDPGLKRTLGELLISSRETHENFRELEQWFPVQPEDAALGLRPVPIPENTVVLDDLLIYEGTWPILKGDTARSLYIPPSTGQFSQVTAAFYFLLSNGTKNGITPASPGTFSGLTAGLSGSSRTGGTLPSCLNGGYGSAAFPVGKGPRRWNIARSGEQALAIESKIWLATCAVGGLLTHGTTVSSTGTAGKFGNITLEVPITRSTEVLFATYTRKAPVFELPTKISDIGRSGEGSTEGSGACAGGFQIFLPTEEEREKEVTHTFTWEFAVREPVTYSARCDPYELA